MKKNVSHITNETINNIDFISKAVISSKPEKDWLVNGKLGKVVYLITLAEYSGEEKYSNEAFKLLSDILQNIGKSNNNIKLSTSIARGLSGIGLVIHILKESGWLQQTIEIESLEKKFIEILFPKIIQEIDNNDLDALHSCVGAIYFFSKIFSHHCCLKNYLLIIIDKLLSKVEDNNVGSYIRNGRYETNQGINLGLAHGFCGILLTILELRKTEIHTSKLELLLEKSTNFILAYHNKLTKIDFQEKYAFPRMVFEQDTLLEYRVTEYTPLGWCYSDISLCYMLKKISVALEDTQLSTKIDKIAVVDSLRRNYTSTLIDSSFFCHGSSGYAWCLKKYYDLSDKSDLYDSHKNWIEITNEKLENEKNNGVESLYAHDILNGWNGVGLVLMSSIKDIKLNWDTVFLLS